MKINARIEKHEKEIKTILTEIKNNFTKQNIEITLFE